MTALDTLLSLGLALAVGLLVGLERERSDLEEASAGQPAEPRVAGVRTFALIALTGAVSALLVPPFGVWVMAGALLGVIVLVTASYAASLRRGTDHGLTTEVAVLLTFLMGALAGSDVPGGHETKLVVVASLAVGVTALLAFKPTLHRLASKVSRQDLYATLQFILAAAVVLPLAPNEAMGPLDAFNPFTTVLMIVLIAGISFVGYVAVRLLGPDKGLGVTGLVGGLVSSTAITLSMASRARSDEGLRASCLLAVLAASTIMYARVVLEVAVVHPPLVAAVSAPMGAMFAASLVATLVIWRQSRREAPATSDVELGNPFQLTSALGFGLMFAGVLFVAKVANTYAGDLGVYLTGLLAGTTDVDAITLSMANMVAEGGIGAREASITILLGTVSNVAVKGGMALAIGGWAFGRGVLAAYLLTVAAGGLALVGLGG